MFLDAGFIQLQQKFSNASVHIYDFAKHLSTPHKQDPINLSSVTIKHFIWKLEEHALIESMPVW